MSSPLSDDIVEYSDGTSASVDQMAKDVTTIFNLGCGARIRGET